MVVTNPPFSLFKEYIALLIEYNKKFIVIGNMNAITYKDFFQYIKDNKLWAGYGFNLSMIFRTPYKNTLESNRKYVLSRGYDPDKNYVKNPGMCWYTNIDIKKRNEKMILFRKYDKERYPNYFNFDGIDVNKVDDIPIDYKGYMGVPITFLDKYNPEQFKLIGLGTYVEKKYIHTVTENKKTIEYIDKKTNESKWVFPYTVNERKIGNSLRIEENGKPTSSPYGRIVIKAIESEEKNNEN